MVDGYPTAMFGKPEGSGSYQIIEQNEAFEATEIAQGFRRIYSSFEWRATADDSKHPPCYAILPIGSQALVAKYSDTGRDLTGRPHTLDVECILIELDQVEAIWKQVTLGDPIPENWQSSFQIVGNRSTFSANQ